MAVVRVSWGTSQDKKVYEEIGKVFVHMLPLVTRVVIADSEGAILELDDNEMIEELKEELEDLRKQLKYIEVEFESSEE